MHRAQKAKSFDSQTCQLHHHQSPSQISSKAWASRDEIAPPHGPNSERRIRSSEVVSPTRGSSGDSALRTFPGERRSDDRRIFPISKIGLRNSKCQNVVESDEFACKTNIPVDLKSRLNVTSSPWAIPTGKCTAHARCIYQTLFVLPRGIQYFSRYTM